MRPLTLLLAFICLAQLLFAQQFLLKGTVHAAGDSSRVPFATVLNQATKSGISSNLKGDFSLRVSVGDSIRITAVGFTKQLFVATPGDAVSFYLTTDVQQIDTIVVRAMPPRQLFKHEFMALELPEEEKIDLHVPTVVTALMLPLDAGEIPVRALNEISPPGVTLSFFTGGALTELKKKKEEMELDRQKQLMLALDRKYSNEFISKLTGIQDADKIAELKKFCNLSNEFIVSSTEYDVGLAIVDCYQEFVKE